MSTLQKFLALKSPFTYISGAITGTSFNERTLFHTAQQQLEAQGRRVFNPLEFDVPYASTNEEMWNHAISRDLHAITHAQCKGICVLDTYARSKGALLEIFTAISIGRPIVLLPHQPTDWTETVIATVREAQTTLWANVERLRYTHHTILPERVP